MQRCSYFVKERALFGSFPSQETVNMLEESGVRYFIDLTGNDEGGTVPYETKHGYIKYPIKDNNIPEDWKEFARLVIHICGILKKKENEKIYIHCKGGHGRSGVLVACVLCYYHKISPKEALHLTSKYHGERVEMREKWRKIGSPQTRLQKEFVYKFFKAIYYDGKRYTRRRNEVESLEKSQHDSKSTQPEQSSSIREKSCNLNQYYTDGFDNTSPHSVVTSLGEFPNAYLAFQAYKDPENKEYLNSLKEGKYNSELIRSVVENWDEKKISYMFQVIENKLKQHPRILSNLLNTGLRILIKNSSNDFWGYQNGKGKNMHGWILYKLREKFLKE